MISSSLEVAVCDTVVAVQKDRILFAKNSDRDPNEAQLLEWHPREEHGAAATVTCTWIEIPQVARTNAVVLSRPFWMWGAEMGTNEHGLVIGNEAVFTREPCRATGLTGMDLVRLALERTTTARDAVDTICELIERHGQGGGCGYESQRFRYHSSFLIADPVAAFVLETSGDKWASEAVTHTRTISNGLSIAGFAEEHSDRVRTRVSEAHVRQRRTQELADAATSVRDMMWLLRDHGRDLVGRSRKWPTYSWVNGGMSAPCMHAGGMVANSRTASSWVAELRPEGSRHWVTGTALPCLSLFKPIRISRPIDLRPEPSGQADLRALWWRQERLNRTVMRAPEQLAPLFLEERDTIEQSWIRDRPETDAAFAEGDRLLEQWTERVLAETVTDRRPLFVRRYWRARNRDAGLEV